jgi:hypothetical protein
MSALFGATNLFGATAPSGFVQETSEEISVDVVTLKDQTGKVVEARPKLMKTKKVTIKTKGAVDLIAMHSGEFTAGTLVATESKVDETQDFPSSEVTYTAYL